MKTINRTSQDRIFNKIKMYQSIIQHAKDEYLRKVCNGRSNHQLENQIQLPLGYLWSALKLLQNDDLAGADCEVNRAKCYVIKFTRWVGNQVR